MKSKNQGAKILFDLRIYNQFLHDLLLFSDRHVRQSLIFATETWIRVVGKLLYLSIEEIAFKNFCKGIYFYISVFFKVN